MSEIIYSCNGCGQAVLIEKIRYIYVNGRLSGRCVDCRDDYARGEERDHDPEPDCTYCEENGDCDGVSCEEE